MGGQKSESPTTSMASPSISGIVVDDGVRNTGASTSGGDVVTLVGDNFGPILDNGDADADKIMNLQHSYSDLLTQ